MKSIVLVLSILSVILAGNCGTYESGCSNSLFGRGSSRSVAYVTCNLDGYVSHYDVKMNDYSATKCEGKMYALYKYMYKTVKKDDSTTKKDAQYTATLTKATIKSDDVAEFTQGLKCTPEMKKGKTYSFKDISCVLLIIDIFASVKASMDKPTDVTMKFTDEKVTIIGGFVSGSFNKTSSFWGCFQGWSLTLLILIIIFVIVAIVVPFVVNKKKSKSKCLPKKK